jgi:hypothetical protein
VTGPVTSTVREAKIRKRWKRRALASQGELMHQLSANVLMKAVISFRVSFLFISKENPAVQAAKIIPSCVQEDLQSFVSISLGCSLNHAKYLCFLYLFSPFPAFNEWNYRNGNIQLTGFCG